MKKHLLLLPVILAVSTFTVNADNIPAFPGAEGHGRYTTGGRGGAIYHVTTLEDNASGENLIEGSLRWALGKSGTKTIVFDVAGTIHLKQELRSGKDNLTIAGQTSPGGICLADYPFSINSNNLIIRFIRFRPGDISGGEPDGLGGMDKQNIIIDHCSVSWSVDECLSVYGMQNSTVQWCIASEALRVSTHDKGTHCYGGNWGGNQASYLHNLIAHCESRTPRLGPRYTTQENEYVDIRNCVFYNWAGNGCYGGEGQNVNLVNNYYKPGPATDSASSKVQYRIAGIGIRTTDYVTTYPAYAPMLHVWGTFFVDGNIMEGHNDVTNDNWTNGIYAQINNSSCDNLFTNEVKTQMHLSAPLGYGIVTTHTAADAYERVLDYGGCCLYRDDVDKRIISDTRNRTATYTAKGNKPGYINTQTDQQPANWAEAWPSLPTDTTRQTTDTDGDGIPDYWEIENGLNRNNVSDGRKVCNDGYTNLEHYLNSLVQNIIDNGNEGGILSNTTQTRKNLSFECIQQYNHLYIKAETAIEVLQIFNLTGQNIYSTRPQSAIIDINTVIFPKGIYIIKASNSKYQVTQKIRIG